MAWRLPMLLLLPTLIMSTANAYPRLVLSERSSSNDDNQKSSGPDSKTFIIAGVVVGVVFLGLATLTIHRMRKGQLAHTPSGPINAAAIIAANPSSANVSTAAATTTTTTAATPAAGRRPRRTRRTPSQISTKSLPAYNENPGDEELVLVQRATEPESYARPAHQTSESIDVQTPLIQEEHESDMHDDDDDDDRNSSHISTTRRSSTQHRVNPSIDSMATGSGDTHDSNHSTANLLSGHAGGRDERGEAPPYMEHVEHDHDHELPLFNTPGSAGGGGESNENRRSLMSRMMPTPIRNLFGGDTATRSRPTSQLGPSHSHSSSVPMVQLTEATIPSAAGGPARPRADTANSDGSRPSMSLSITRSRSPSNSASRFAGLGSALTRPLTNNSAISANSNSSLHAGSALAGHQRNRSGSSLAPSSFLDPNPNGSTPRLTSPSTSSLSSLTISSPLAHTATRTDFRFPKKGPTPDQLKFLSSRETLGRFGVPFGEDAERTYPNQRPPPFEEDGSAGGSAGAGGASEDLEEQGREQRRTRPGSWWKNLTRAVGGEGDGDAVGTPGEASGSGSGSQAPLSLTTDVPNPSANANALSPIDEPTPTLTQAASIPLPLSTHPSVRSTRSGHSTVYASPASTPVGSLSAASARNAQRPRSSSVSISSQRTDGTFLTAADTERAGASDVETTDDDEPRGTTPSVRRVPSTSIDTTAAQDTGFETISLETPVVSRGAGIPSPAQAAPVTAGGGGGGASS